MVWRTILWALALLSACGAAAADPLYPPLPRGGAVQDCADLQLQPVCRERRPTTEDEAGARLNGRDTAWWRDGDTFTVVARYRGTDLTLCCAIQAPMARIPGSDLWTLTVRVTDLDRAVIDIVPLHAGAQMGEWRGPKAPPKARSAAALIGELREETVESRALGEPRELTVYLPPGHVAGVRSPVIYMADGDTAASLARILEPLMLAGRIRPTIIVGLHAAPDGPARHRDYLVNYAGAGEAAFERHDRFLVDEVMPLAEQRFWASNRPDERMTLGFSNGAAWAVATALRRPDLFGKAAALSFGWSEAGYRLRKDLKPKLFLAAGELEPVFAERTRELAATARWVGYDVTEVTPVSGHSSLMWDDLYPQIAEWAFPVVESRQVSVRRPCAHAAAGCPAR